MSLRNDIETAVAALCHAHGKEREAALMRHRRPSTYADLHLDAIASVNIARKNYTRLLNLIPADLPSPG